MKYEPSFLLQNRVKTMNKNQHMIQKRGANFLTYEQKRSSKVEMVYVI